MRVDCINNKTGAATPHIERIIRPSRLLRPKERDSGKIIASGMLWTIPRERATRQRAIVFKASE